MRRRRPPRKFVAWSLERMFCRKLAHHGLASRRNFPVPASLASASRTACGIAIDASTPDGARHRPRSNVLAHGGLGMMHSRAGQVRGGAAHLDGSMFVSALGNHPTLPSLCLIRNGSSAGELDQNLPEILPHQPTYSQERHPLCKSSVRTTTENRVPPDELGLH